MYLLQCQRGECRREFSSTRVDAIWCSSRCGSAEWRDRERARHDQILAFLRRVDAAGEDATTLGYSIPTLRSLADEANRLVAETTR
jgi:hypothetical protein